MIKKFLSVFLVCALLQGTLSSVVNAVTEGLDRVEQEAQNEEINIDSSFAVDVGDSTYLCENGSILRDNTVLVSDNVSGMLYHDGLFYYSSGNQIKTYDEDSKKTKVIETREGDISSFTLADGALYTFDGKYIVSTSQGKLLDMTSRMTVKLWDGHWSSVSLSECLFFSVYGNGDLLLYFENPDYDPLDSYNNPDQYNVFIYSISERTLTWYDPFTSEDGTVLEDFTVNAGESYQIGKYSFPLEEYPVGSFFTKNGKSCTCHNQGICVAAKESKGCNCIRYWPSEKNYEIDLKSSQCWGFAEFCEYRAYVYRQDILNQIHQRLRLQAQCKDLDGKQGQGNLYKIWCGRTSQSGRSLPFRYFGILHRLYHLRMQQIPCKQLLRCIYSVLDLGLLLFQKGVKRHNVVLHTHRA